MNRKEELRRLRKLQDKPKEGESILHLNDGSQVAIPNMARFGGDVLYGNGASESLFKQVEAIEESGDSRLGELLSMVVGPVRE